MENDTIEEDDFNVNCDSKCQIHYHVVKHYNKLVETVKSFVKKIMMCFG